VIVTNRFHPADHFLRCSYRSSFTSIVIASTLITSRSESTEDQAPFTCIPSHYLLLPRRKPTIPLSWPNATVQTRCTDRTDDVQIERSCSLPSPQILCQVRGSRRQHRYDRTPLARLFTLAVMPMFLLTFPFPRVPCDQIFSFVRA
jgi:hypothetical protein